MLERGVPRGRVLLAFAAIYLLWGSTYLAIRYAVETLPPFLMAGTRHLAAGVLLFAWNRLRGEPAPRWRDWRIAALIGALLLLGGNGLVSWAEQRVPSGLAALIVASVPLWMTVLGAIERRSFPRVPVVAGLVLGLGALALLVAPGKIGGNGHLDPLGAAALLFAALSWAAGSLYSRRAKLGVSTLMAISMEMIAGGTILWAAGLLLGEGAGFHLSTVTSRSILSLGYLIVFGSLAGFSAYMWLLRVTTPARVSTYAYVNPVVAVLLGWAFAGEAMTLRTGLAAAGIVGAVALIIGYGGRTDVGESPRSAEEPSKLPLRAEKAS